MDTERLLGHKIDQYKIEQHVARGGMADVYLAKDEDLERHVAFKVMLDTLATDDQFVRRFRREARTVARLDHPNIVQVYSTGQTPLGQPYIAMQYIPGGSLREKLEELAERNKLLTTEQVLNIMRQLAVALGIAHQAQVIHRDLKPGNILIRPDGTPVLVDLGIAAVQSGAKLTHTGGFVGTPAYMSPEQFRGLPLDGRSDLYSLGIIFYELFAGNRPFDAEDITAIMYKHVHEEPVPLHRLRPDLTPQTLSIVETLLKKEPEQRFQTADALVAAIDRAIAAEGGFGPNPQATQVLTRLDDGSLISRGGTLRVASTARTSLPHIADQPAGRRIPLWVIISVIILVGGLAAVTFLRPDDTAEPSVVEDTAPATSATELSRSGQAVPTTAPEAAITDLPEPEPELIAVNDADEDATPEPAPDETEPTLPPPSATITFEPTLMPTEPPTATGTSLPSATPTMVVCVGALPTRLSVGDQARVVNYQINVRTGPGTNFGVENTLLPGRVVDIIGGPECNDGQLWYEIRSEPFTNSAGERIQVVGWSVEESGSTYFLEPAN
ncbi:MAG: hypothetical protein CL608_21810 [Anaerolineaceae bacterium]|nr:hypothetical protein [Anaerolineaceae bacterium]